MVDDRGTLGSKSFWNRRSAEPERICGPIVYQCPYLLDVNHARPRLQVLSGDVWLDPASDFDYGSLRGGG